MKRKHAPETAEAVTLEEVRAAVRWAPLPPRKLDYREALESVPRGRVATPGAWSRTCHCNAYCI